LDIQYALDFLKYSLFGKPLFVFDSERRSIVAPNGMYIPKEGRLVMTDAPPVGTKSENAEKPVKVGFSIEIVIVVMAEDYEVVLGIESNR
jgi:hypothetical protein